MFLFVQKIIVEVAPYWNVNVVEDAISYVQENVEVAPYWNVNTVICSGSFEVIKGRSSSILECKY